MLGLFQITNAVTALDAVDALVENGPMANRQPGGRGDGEEAHGRAAWKLVGKDPLVVLDGARNQTGVGSWRLLYRFISPGAGCISSWPSPIETA